MRILSVNPGFEHVGVAVFEGETLLWYGVKTIPGPRTISAVRLMVQQHLAAIVEKYGIRILAIEEPFYIQSLLSTNLMTLTQGIKTWAKLRGLRVRGYKPPEVKAFFCRDQKTKQSLAEAMIAKYPFLNRYFSYLPLRRRYWFNVFDAIGLGLMCAKKLNPENSYPRIKSIS